MAELESQPLSDEERAELEELRAEKARRERRIRIGARARTQARCCEACTCRAQTSA